MEANKGCEANEPSNTETYEDSPMLNNVIVSQGPPDVNETITGHHRDVQHGGDWCTGEKSGGSHTNGSEEGWTADNEERDPNDSYEKIWHR